jgi:tetratricopeptide (TPR) repeat protein
MRHFIVLALALAAAPVLAQQAEKPEPRRPVLEAGRDTNNAREYYQFGLRRLGDRSDEAANAFYWASRLDPMWAEPLYARRIALLMRMDDRSLGDYLDRSQRVLSRREVRFADSLATRAMWRDPLLYRRLDANLIEGWLRRATNFEVGLRDMENVGPATRAWILYTRGEYVQSVKQYDVAIKRDDKAYWLHGDRARAFAMMLQYDSTLAELQLELREQRKREKDLVREYESKAMNEYMIGRVHEMRGSLDDARAAYGRALTEELSFHAAHEALGRVALAQGDTAAAVAEYRSAVELMNDDPALQYEYGVALLAARKFEDAQKAFLRAVELDRYFVAPYFPLAYIEYNSGDDKSALAHYTAFATLAPHVLDSDIARARTSIAEITSQLPPATATATKP